jgi:hypothetical protein
VDTAGNAYVTGLTYSADFPTASPIQANLAGTSGTDAFVLELNSSGSALLYSTYLGGTTGFYSEWGQGLTIDNDGNVYVTGTTFSSDFPTTSGAFRAVRHCFGVQLYFSPQVVNTNESTSSSKVSHFFLFCLHCLLHL